MKSIYDYLDYREYLKYLFEEKKKEHSFYSYRLFSMKAGFKSPNFLKLVIDGQRNLTKESVFKFVKAFNLNKRESDYFENLVFLNQSKTIDEKNSYLVRLMHLRVKSDPKKIEESEYEYYSNWYNPVIRELVTAIDFRDDFKKLGASVIPCISAADAKRSVELLIKLKMIEKKKISYYKTSISLTTGPQVRSVAIANYHKAMMKLAADSIERFSADTRDITSLTMAVSDTTYNIIIEKLQALRREMLDMAEADQKTDKVVQLNLQLFPLTMNLCDEEDGKC
jgi:uncharacterized protein (TIGR02147 family)